MTFYYKCYQCPSVDYDEYDNSYWCSELDKEVHGLCTDPDCPLLTGEDA